MPHVQRIYNYSPGHAPAVFVDRLYPRGVRKELMAQVQWLKALTPSTELRRWYHADMPGRASEFAARYLQELTAPAVQADLAAFKNLLATHPDTVVLTAVKDPSHSHVPVLLQAAEARETDVRWA